MLVTLPVTTTLKEERVVLAYSSGGSDAWFVDSVVLGSVVKVGMCGRGGCSFSQWPGSKGERKKKARFQILISLLRTLPQMTKLSSSSSHVPKVLLLPCSVLGWDQHLTPGPLGDIYFPMVADGETFSRGEDAS